MNGHTEVPWNYRYRIEHDQQGKMIRETYAVTADSGNKTICEMDAYPEPTGEANAAFIVQACNSHDQLLKACKAVISDMKFESTRKGLNRHGDANISGYALSLVEKAVEAVEGGEMKITTWNVINAADDIIKIITTSPDNRRAASRKLKFLYPDGWAFLRLEKAGDYDLEEGGEQEKTAHCSGCGKPCEIIHDFEISVCCQVKVVWKKEGGK